MFELTVVRSKSEILLHSCANRMQYLLLCCLYRVLWKHPDLVQVTTLDFHLMLLGLNAILSLLLSPLHKKKKHWMCLSSACSLPRFTNWYYLTVGEI